MMYKIIISVVALAASATAATAEQVNAFVCDHRNKPVARQALSHGQIARICIQPAESGVSLEGIESFVFSQEESNVEQVAIEGGEVDDTGITELDCTKELCILESYLTGDYFLSGGLTATATGIASLKKGSKLRGGESSELIRSEIQLILKVKTHPLPAMVHSYAV
jgi:hypothetical protein